MIFVDVILPLPLVETFTFEVPEHFENIQIGTRVVVQFGKKKIYTALVFKKHAVAPQGYIVKPILEIVEDIPIVSKKQLKFWEWISNYYCCSLGEVMNVALPSSVKLSSETKFTLTEKKVDYTLLNQNELSIIKTLEKKSKLSINDVFSIINTKKAFLIIESLLDKNLIHVFEELNESYKPKIKKFIRLENFHLDISELKNAKKQLQVFDFLVEYHSNNPDSFILMKDLIFHTQCSYQTIKALVSKSIISVLDLKVERIDRFSENQLYTLPILSNAQKNAFDSINNQFITKDVVLLHGITSSGKTEIYINLINELIKKGQQVLYLLPEIALTSQIIRRLQLYFGDKVVAYHSKLNQHERTEIWKDLRSGNRYSVVIGARSSLFLPFNNLGCIIVDEEHENTFKQFQPNPKYHARDCSIMLAKMLGIKVLLGSATPSIESYYNSKIGKYGFVSLNERYGNMELPDVEIVDLKYLRHRKLLKSSFSKKLLDGIKTSLKNSEQVILFQNRRGFAPVSTCLDCGWVYQCKSCDVSLTYHKNLNLLKCHYCGFSASPIEKCHSCNSHNISVKGLGTEKIEEELTELIPDARIKRMDLDTTSKKNAHQNIINEFEQGKIDILIGTQMVTKGLDFDNVSVVGVINADNMLNFPDFRSHERSFNLMVQVAGRAGRKKKRGKVIIQTYSAQHEIIKAVIESNYNQMYNDQISERKAFGYPPFIKLIELEVSHRNFEINNLAAKDLANALRESFGTNVLGPEYPMVSRIKNLYIKNILLKIDSDISSAKVKKHVLNLIRWLKSQSKFRTVKVKIDVDPV